MTETDPTILTLFERIKGDLKIQHMIAHRFEYLGGQEVYILNVDENGNYLSKLATDRLEFYQDAIDRVNNRKKGTLPPDWVHILPENLTKRLAKNKSASEILYHYFYDELGGIYWRYWSAQDDIRAAKCTEIAENCLKTAAKYII